PTLSHTADTFMYMYYGNAGASDQQNKTAVWDSNYKGVWHLPDGTTLNANDSTSNTVHGTITGASAVAAEVDGGASFNGSTNQINFGNAAATANLGAQNASTFSFWMNPLSTTLGVIMNRNDNNTVAPGWWIKLNSN